MAQNPVAIVTTVEDVVVIPDDGQIVITLNVGGPKVDLALDPDLALRLDLDHPAVSVPLGSPGGHDP